MSNEALVTLLLVGLVAGWLAGQLVVGTGLGLFGDLIIGVAGAFVGGLLLPRLGIHLGFGLIATVANATIGAALLLLALRLVSGGGGWRARWGGHFGRRW